MIIKLLLWEDLGKAWKVKLTPVDDADSSDNSTDIFVSTFSQNSFDSQY